MLGENGRLDLRYSGTEPLARIMIEGRDKREIELHAEHLAEVDPEIPGGMRPEKRAGPNERKEDIVRLAVNIDHFATLREARKQTEPEPVLAALLAEQAGAEGIVCHLRSDRRHIKERDLLLLRESIKTKLNVEMAATTEMQKVAIKVRPDVVSLVPERPEELTTEGGLNVVSTAPPGPLREEAAEGRNQGQHLHRSRHRPNPDRRRVWASTSSRSTPADTPTSSPASPVTKPSPIIEAAEYGRGLGLEVHAGHGLDYHNVLPIVAIPQISELSIGFSIVARAAIVGLEKAVREMRAFSKRVGAMDIRVDIERLRADIEALGFGRDPKGGSADLPSAGPTSKPGSGSRSGSPRRGLDLPQDGAGNIFGRLERPRKDRHGRLPHRYRDQRREVRRLDGRPGGPRVPAAIKEEKLPLGRPLEVASFTDEEGNLVGDFLGSRAFMGLLNGDELRRGRTQFGRPPAEVLKGTEFTIDGILEAHAGRPELEAYLELHIEQGPILDTEEVPVGLVEAIAGKRYLWCSFIGNAAHAGTTPLELRQDAFLGLADFAIEGHAARGRGSLREHGDRRQRWRSIRARSASSRAGRNSRSITGAPRRETLRDLDQELAGIAEDSGLRPAGFSFASKLMDATEPVLVPERLLGILEDECGRLGIPFLRVRSGAGHDAQILAAVCDAGMIFIPCPDGASHSRRGHPVGRPGKGANVLLGALVKLAT